MKYITFFFLLFSTSLLAEKAYTEQEWGLAGVVRTASIPYNSQNFDTVSSFVPLMFFDSEYFYLNGLEGGVKLYDENQWRFSVLARIRFVDIPQAFQNQLQGSATDLGVQARYRPFEGHFFDLEFLQDTSGYSHASSSYGFNYKKGSLQLQPYANLRYKSADFNRHYYALEQDAIGSGIDGAVGLKLKYHVNSNLYLIGSAQTRWLDPNARKTSVTNQNTENEVSLGVGFFNDHTKAKKSTLKISPYLRVAHGWATPSNLNEILTGNTRTDEYNNQLTSLFYGYPLTDELFGLPLEIYLTPGFVWHHSSEVQNTSQEYVVAIKAYYTINLPIRFRLGVAEGLSYINEVTYIERTELENKEYIPNRLLNYLDLTLDMNLGDIFGKDLDKFWLGYSIHHRSAIFESAAQFGRIKGGSNYNTLYLQWHF